VGGKKGGHFLSKMGRGKNEFRFFQSPHSRRYGQIADYERDKKDHVGRGAPIRRVTANRTSKKTRIKERWLNRRGAGNAAK